MCFNGCVRARSLGTAAQNKKKGEPLLVFTGLWFGICEEEEFEGLED
jgi:hypothetical protein